MLFFNHFRSMTQKNCDFGRRHFCWAVKTALIVSSRNICEKELAKSTLLSLCLEFQQKNFKNLAKSFLQYCQNCLFLDQMELWRAKRFQKLQPYLILALSENFQILIEDFSVGLSIPLSRCLEESFEGREFRVRNFFFYHFRPFCCKCLQRRRQNECSDCKTAFFVSGATFEDLFLQLFNFFPFFGAWSGKFPYFWHENFWQGCRRWE